MFTFWFQTCSAIRSFCQVFPISSPAFCSLYQSVLQKEISVQKSPIGGTPPSSLESLNKLNHSSCGGGVSGGVHYLDTGFLEKSEEDCYKPNEPPSTSSLLNRPKPDPVGSLSDSLYDSFSSCTSQGSHKV